MTIFQLVYTNTIRQNSFYTVLNVMSVSTALFLYYIYYLEITWNYLF